MRWLWRYGFGRQAEKRSALRKKYINDLINGSEKNEARQWLRRDLGLIDFTDNWMK